MTTATVVNTISIRRPILDVFETLTNAENTEKWFPGNVKEWWTTEPPTRVGSVRHAVAKVLWFRNENDGEVTVYEPPSRAVLRIDAPGMPYEVSVAFTFAEGATRVVVTSDISFSGIRRFMAPLVMPIFRTAWERGLANLKRLMESGQL